jgi:hypothetical protein
VSNKTEEFDLSTNPGTGQRLIFALFGIGQLVLSSIAFQRGGFFYGLLVLGCGIAMFCTALVFAHRLNRRLVRLSAEGIAIEEGLRMHRNLAWEEIKTLSINPRMTVFHTSTGADITLHNLSGKEQDMEGFLQRLAALSAERQIPIQGTI